MDAHAEVYMIAKDRARPNGVAPLPNHFRQRAADYLAVAIAEPEHGMIEPTRRAIVKLAQLHFGRLLHFPPKMNRSEVLELNAANFRGPAPAEVIGQPVPVSPDHQMVGDDRLAMNYPWHVLEYNANDDSKH
jgi:hypothetical protein